MQPIESLTRRGQVARLRQLAAHALAAYAIDAPRITKRMVRRLLGPAQAGGSCAAVYPIAG